MIKTCVYLRKSREDERLEKELGKGETLSLHRKDLLRIAKIKGLTIIKIHEELVSGESLLYRPAMLELLKEVQDGLYDAVLVMDLQRLGRGDMEEQGIILKAFKKTGTKIITPDKVYDLDNEFDEEYSEFEAFMSRKEYKMINKRLQRGVIRSVQNGNYNSPYTPFGYIIKDEKIGRTLEPHPEQSKVIKMIFDWYVNDSIGSQIISDRLNEMGIRTNRNNKWSSRAICSILKNPLYIGKISWGKCIGYKTRNKKNAAKTQPRENWIIAEGKHPALVTEALFNKANEIMKNSTKSPAKPKSGLTNPLAGLIVCGVCGAKLRYRPYGEVEPHMICINKCGNKSSKFRYVETAVLNSLQKYMESYSYDLNNDSSDVNDVELVLKSNISALEKQLTEAQAQKDNIYDLLEQKVYSIEVFTERSKALANKIDSLVDAIRKTKEMHDHEVKKRLEKDEFIPKIANVLREYPKAKTAEAKNALLKDVISRVVYNKGRKCREDNFETQLFVRV